MLEPAARSVLGAGHLDSHLGLKDAQVNLQRHHQSLNLAVLKRALAPSSTVGVEMSQRRPITVSSVVACPVITFAISAMPEDCEIVQLVNGRAHHLADDSRCHLFGHTVDGDARQPACDVEHDRHIKCGIDRVGDRKLARFNVRTKLLSYDVASRLNERLQYVCTGRLVREHTQHTLDPWATPPGTDSMIADVSPLACMTATPSSRMLVAPLIQNGGTIVWGPAKCGNRGESVTWPILL